MKTLINDIGFTRHVKDNIAYKDGDYIEFEPVLLTFNNAAALKWLRERFDPMIEKDEYESFYAQWKQMKYKFRKRWIDSRRQRYISSTECISIIQKSKTGINAFLRSTNVDNKVFFNDICFLSTLLKEGELNIFLSIPHTFGNKKSKIEQ